MSEVTQRTLYLALTDREAELLRKLGETKEPVAIRNHTNERKTAQKLMRMGLIRPVHHGNWTTKFMLKRRGREVLHGETPESH